MRSLYASLDKNFSRTPYGLLSLRAHTLFTCKLFLVPGTLTTKNLPRKIIRTLTSSGFTRWHCTISGSVSHPSSAAGGAKTNAKGSQQAAIYPSKGERERERKLRLG